MRRRLLVARGLIHRPRLVLLDEPTVGLDPQVRQELWSLIDNLRARGVTVLMSTHYIEEAERLADTVAVMSHGRIVALGPPAELVRMHVGRQVLEVYGPPERLAEVSQLAASSGWSTRGRAPAREPGGCFRGADGGGDRMSAEVGIAGEAPAARRVGRLEPAALAGVMSRDIAIFGRYWKATTFSSIVQPTIYLLAFGLGLGTLVNGNSIGHLKYVQYVGTGVVATAVLFSSAFPGMFNTFIRWQFQRTYDAMLAAPVDVEELITAEILWISVRAGIYGVAPLLVAMAFGLEPDPGMLLVPGICFVTGFGFAAFGVTVAAVAKTIDNFNYITSAVLTPLLPDLQASRGRAHRRRVQPALPLRTARARCFAGASGHVRPGTSRGARRLCAADVAACHMAAGSPADRLTYETLRFLSRCSYERR
jgi:lipooligosaccharide transport system permease protein